MRLGPMPVRRGATLAGTLVALALSSVAVALVSRVAVEVLRQHARAEARARARHDLADALDAVARRLRHALPAAGDLAEAGGGALALHVLAASTLLCHQAGDTVFLAAAHAEHPWAASWSTDPAPGHRLRVATGDPATRAAVTIVHARRVDRPCAPGARPWPLRVAWAAVVDGPRPAWEPGTPLHLLVRERVALHAGGDGAIALGLAAWDHGAGRWATPQPLVAPLAPGSLRVAALDADATPLPIDRLAETRLVRVVARHALAPDADTLLVDVVAP